MTIFEILSPINGKIINCTLDNSFNGVSIDTRTLKCDDLLICLNDAYKYIDSNINCAGIVVDVDLNIELEIPIIRVANTFDTLLLLAKYYRDKYINIPLIAITGSVGKTTTKDFICSVLSMKYNVLKSEKNYNNHIGLPLTLFNIKDEHSLIIAELGMNHAGEISKLSKIAQPNLAIITNIGTSHIGNLGNYENIKKAKMEIVDGLNGPLLIDLKYDVEYDNIIYLDNFEIHDIFSNISGTSFKINYMNNEYAFETNIIGRHLINNILVAIQVGLIYDIEIKDIIFAIKNLELPDKRLNIYKRNYTLIDDSYNASYESVIGALNLIDSLDSEKIIILGDILELGEYSREIHLMINDALKGIDATVLLVGEETKVVDGIHFEDNDELINFLKMIKLDDKVILLKGSRRMRLEKIKDFILNDYN